MAGGDKMGGAAAAAAATTAIADQRFSSGGGVQSLSTRAQYVANFGRLNKLQKSIILKVTPNESPPITPPH